MLAVGFAAWLAHAQLPFPLTKIEEIGNLGSYLDDRKDANLGLAHAYADGEETLRIEGRDAQGLPWRVWIPRVGRGFGFTRVFRADFDSNGQPDLLFTAHYIPNGRCIDAGTVTTLFFGVDGRPMPWRSRTHGLAGDDQAPVTLVDLNADGRAELVTSTCEYAFREDRSMAEDRWITGVYEARDGRWVPMRPRSLDPYLSALQPRFAEFEPGYIEWKPAAEEWPDPAAGLESKERLEVAGLLTGEIGCQGVVRPPPQEGEDKGCDESSWRERVRYSDGKLRLGWPAVIFDTPAGREIHMADSRAALERTLIRRYPVRVLGPDAEPGFLWADTDAPLSGEGRLTLQLAISHASANPIAVSDETGQAASTEALYYDPNRFAIVAAEPSTDPSEMPDAVINSEFASFFIGLSAGSPLPELPGPRGTYFSREGRCFEFPRGTTLYERVRPLADCKELGFLESAATQGERVYLAALDGMPRRLSPAKRTIRWVINLQGAGEHLSRLIEFRPLPDRVGDLVGASEFPPGWLAQWSRAGESWFVLHSRDGEPLSPAIRVDVEGELFDLDRSRGLVFLRWSGGIPVEATRVRAAMEWVREP
jgi:hypothetical protein